MIVFHKIAIFLLTSTTYSYHLQCPDISQRPLRAQAYCTNKLRSEYTCLYDTNRIMFSEQCYKNPDYVTRGEKYVITGRLRNVDCSSERYQPFPLWANVSGVCLFRKTLCEEEGQVVFNSGTKISDGACRCDYTKGYKFIQQPKHNCFCKPSAEDCSCYISKCGEGLNLASDYACVDEEHHNDSKCPELEKKSGSRQSQIITRNEDEGIQKSFNKSDFYKVVVIGFVVCPLLLLVIVIWGKVWKPHCYKMILVLLLYAALFPSFVIVLIFVDDDMNTVAIGVSLLVVSAVWGSIYVGYIFATHHLVKPPNVYDEHYELQIYKLLKAASEGDINKLRSINNENYIDINDTDYDKRSALHLAACEGHFDAVNYLLKHNAGYIDGKDRCLCLTAAEDAKWHMRRNDNETKTADFERIIDLLKNHSRLQKVKIHFKDLVAMKIIKAGEYGEVNDLKSLKDSGTDMNLSDPDGRTALHAAAERNQEKVINFLIDECKVSPFVRWRGRRPVDLIKLSFHKFKITEKLKEYMDKQKSSLTTEEQYKTKDEVLMIVRLFNSALRGDIRQIKAYKAADYKMNVVDYDKRTALHIAVNNNQEHVVKYLLTDCSLTDDEKQAKDRWGKTPFDSAKEEGNENMLRIFRCYCPNLVKTENDVKDTFTLLMAGTKDDVNTFKRLYQNGDSRNKVLNLAADEKEIDLKNYLTETCNKENKQVGVFVTCTKVTNNLNRSQTNSSPVKC